MVSIITQDNDVRIKVSSRIQLVSNRYYELEEKNTEIKDLLQNYKNKDVHDIIMTNFSIWF